MTKEKTRENGQKREKAEEKVTLNNTHEDPSKMEHRWKQQLKLKEERKEEMGVMYGKKRGQRKRPTCWRKFGPFRQRLLA
mmetsp:Transcript_21446/g.46612  ORF Transcript_21446/g.46612 Transcript_21446/m.46612 type:complete len:80 (-) Transcript_21446:1001-1240(-)